MSKSYPVISFACYKRPQFLKVNLLQLLKNKEGEGKYNVFFSLDVGHDPKVEQLIDWFTKTGYAKDVYSFRLTKEMKKSLMPATDNIIWSYIGALNFTDSYILPAEEDIIFAEDYIRFNEAVINKYLVNNYPYRLNRIGWVAHKIRRDPIDGDSELLIGDYQSTSPSAITVDTLRTYLLPHFMSLSWYTNPIQYNQLMFPKSRIPHDSFLDHDCMIERIMEAHRLFVLKPDHARSAHIGFTGGITGKEKGEDLSNYEFDKQVEILQSILYDTEALKAKAHVNKHDIIGLPKLKPWNDLDLDIYRSAKSSSWHYDTNNEFKDFVLS